MSLKYPLKHLLLFLIFVGPMAGICSAQTTTFNYQGRITDGGTPPTASYDFEFRLFDADGAVVAGQQRLNVRVVSGVFNVSLDFGAGAFPWSGTHFGNFFAAGRWRSVHNPCPSTSYQLVAVRDQIGDLRECRAAWRR